MAKVLVRHCTAYMDFDRGLVPRALRDIRDACDQLAEQLLRMLGVLGLAADDARALASAPLPAAEGVELG